MLKIYPANINELKKEKKRTFLNDIVNFDDSEIYVLFDSSNTINLSNKISDNVSKSTKYFRILDKTPFYILKIENDIYLIKRNKIKEVKKYIYKNKINKNILLSNIIDPNMTEKTYYMLGKGLQIEQLELINVKDINSIEEFKILTLENKKESKIVKNDDNKAIHLKSEKSFLEIKEDLEFFVNNLNYLNFNNDIKYLLLSLFSIKKDDKINYFYAEYSKLNVVGNYIKIKREEKQEYINKNNITKIELKNEKKDLEFSDPLGKEFFYKIYIVEIKIYIDTKKDPEIFYCFEEDLKKNELFKVNKNKFLKEI